ncbi:hypothetical protein EVAR_5282_1 [Eumeta japonica]|uniref:Uncharacterized protein n=1 Tax=Eumeta variegata TaxID=151549 RepID=A0A4C1TNX9_EUMVA|nr:hypothetical protein EVAR_5282_1 [Eumeta japonica]
MSPLIRRTLSQFYLKPPVLAQWRLEANITTVVVTVLTSSETNGSMCLRRHKASECEFRGPLPPSRAPLDILFRPKRPALVTPLSFEASHSETVISRRHRRRTSSPSSDVVTAAVTNTHAQAPLLSPIIIINGGNCQHFSTRREPQ